MKQKSFLISLLIKAASVIFLLVGLLFLYASYFGESNQLVGLVLVSAGCLLAMISLLVTNLSVISMQTELKDAYQLAHQISQGDIFTSIHDEDLEENSELKSLLRQIGVY
jgi:HAMP domain-containing protein